LSCVERGWWIGLRGRGFVVVVEMGGGARHATNSVAPSFLRPFIPRCHSEGALAVVLDLQSRGQHCTVEMHHRCVASCSRSQKFAVLARQRVHVVCVPKRFEGGERAAGSHSLDVEAAFCAEPSEGCRVHCVVHVARMRPHCGRVDASVSSDDFSNSMAVSSSTTRSSESCGHCSEARRSTSAPSSPWRIFVRSRGAWSWRRVYHGGSS
jgi:hypothetical protein